MFNEPDTKSEKSGNDSRVRTAAQLFRANAALLAVVLLVATAAVGTVAVVALTPAHELPIGTATTTGDSMGHDSSQLIVYADVEPEVGDTVVFVTTHYDRRGSETLHYEEYIHHRVVDETAEGYITQGDANNAPDQSTGAYDDGMNLDPVPPDRVRGVVIASIPAPAAVGGALLLALLGLAGLLGLYRREAAGLVEWTVGLEAPWSGNRKEVRSLLLVAVVVLSVGAIPFAAVDGSDHTGLAAAAGDPGTQEWTNSDHTDFVNTVATDGSTGMIYSAGNDQEVHAINPDGTQEWSYTGHSADVYSLAVNESAGIIYSGDNSGNVHAINSDGTVKWSTTVLSAERMAHMKVNQSSGVIYVATYAGNSVIALNPDGSQKWEYTGHTSNVEGVAIDSTTGVVYSASWDNEAHAINPDGTKKCGYTGSADGLGVITADGQSGAVYSGGNDALVHAFDASDCTQKWTYDGHGSTVAALAANSDTGNVYSGGFSQEVHAVNSDGTHEWTYTGHSNNIYGMTTDEQKPRLYSGDTNGEVHSLYIEEGQTSSSSSSTGTDQEVGLVQDEIGLFPPEDTTVTVYRRGTEYKSIEDGMAVDTWHEDTWTEAETKSFNWENKTTVSLQDGEYYRLELHGPHGTWEDSGFLYDEAEMSDETIWLEPDTSSTDTNGDGTAGGDGSAGTNGPGDGSTGTPTADSDGTFPTATEQQGFGPTALGTCETFDGQDGVEVEYWDPDYLTHELEANLTVDGTSTYWIHKTWDDPRGYYRGCIADSMTQNASSEADVGLNHSALDGEGEVLSSGSQSFQAPTFGPTGSAPESTGERLGLLAGVLAALGALWFGGNRYVPASSVKSWPSESVSPAFAIGAPIVTVLGLDLAGGGVISAGLATGLAQIAPFAGIVAVTVGGYAALRWIRAPPSS